MIYTPTDLIRRILDTKAVSIWNREKGPIFWYAANVPGPFYVNTELMIGPDLSARLLKEITEILAATDAAPARAAKIETLILSAYEENEVFRHIVETLAAKIEGSFGAESYDVISGGERRDWLFSIPVAKLLGLRHVYLFKNGDVFCAAPFKAGERSVHISDLINNAASYFDAWLPILDKAGLRCAGTACLISRGRVGVDRLEANGQKVVALNKVEVPFFEDCVKAGLIDPATLEELKAFFRSSKEWASTYLMDRADLFDVPAMDAKSFERLRGFLAKDPWEMRGAHKVFFAALEDGVTRRLEAGRG